MSRLLDRVALVTGAASGIGAATVRAFLHEGARVVATDAVPIAWRTSDDRFVDLVHDVRRADQWHTAVATAVERFGGLDILVNSAGLNPGAAPSGRHDPEHVTLEHWRLMQEVNVEGTVLGCQIALPTLRRSSHAAIVNLSSVAAIIGVPANAAYGASKAAIWSYTKSLALHSAEGVATIRCNSVHPGGIKTATFRPLTGGRAGGIEAPHVPMQRYGEPEEVAAAIVFLASDDASYVTGAELFVDGGLSAT
ncbi:MAG: SDR family oxidoreductase [Alphaproteobacteria bacterium]|nr:SDR family oxidoreductase [Alphaproteobacteria bacterium]